MFKSASNSRSRPLNDLRCLAVAWHAVSMTRKSSMTTIDVRGLPEPVIATLQTVVDALRREVPAMRRRRSVRGRGLHVVDGRVKGRLTRHDIYGELG